MNDTQCAGCFKWLKRKDAVAYDGSWYHAWCYKFTAKKDRKALKKL